MGAIQALKIKTIEQMRDDYLRTYRNSLILRGVLDPDVSQGTEIYGRATSLAQQIYGAAVAVPVAADAQMPDTAQAEDLVRCAKVYKLALRPAVGSTGPLAFTATISTPVAIPAGAQLLDAAGLTYVVKVGGSYTPGGSPVPIAAQSTGRSTNLPAGSTLRWVAPPAFCNPTAAVDVGGLIDGADAEDYEGLRARLLERLQTPPNGVNWPAVNKALEDASPAVQKGFSFAAANGPSTMHAAATRAPTPSNKGRDVDALVMAGTVVPAMVAAFPLFVELVTTTVQNYPVSLSIGLALPASTKAAPAGPGGGWTDGDPFPLNLAGHHADITAVSSSTTFTVDSPDAAPIVGSEVCWLSTDDWTLRVGKVTVAGLSNPYTVTVDTPMVSVNGVSIAVGDYLFPNADNMAVYVAAALAGFAKFGPAEKLAPGSALLPRALRRPLASQGPWPSAMLAPFLRNFTDAGEEVSSASYLYQSAVVCPYPAAITDGPFIFVPSRLAFYPI